MSFFRNNATLLLRTYLVLFMLLITIMVISIYFSNYFNFHGDEALYYNYGRMFYETGSLKASFTLDEQASVIGEIGWYGPFYNLIYGSIFKLFGAQHMYMITFHYILLLLCLLMIRYLPLSQLHRLIYAAVTLSTYIICPFVFTSYPEVIQIFLSMILLLVYSKINQNKNRFYLFLILILVFALTRVTLVFWIFSILFLKDFKLSLKLRFLICILFVGSMLLYMKFFQASSTVVGLKAIHETDQLSVGVIFTFITNILNNFKTNLYELFNQSHSSVVTFFTLFSVAGFNVFPLKNKKTIELGLFAVVAITFLTLISLYTTTAIFFEKQIGFLIPILIFIIIHSQKNIPLILFISFGVFLPHALIKTINNYSERKNAYTEVCQYSDFNHEISRLFDQVALKKKVTHVLCYSPDFIVPENYLTCFLPLSKDGSLILYTSNRYSPKNTTIPLKFHTFGNWEIDYILSAYPLDIPNISIVKSNKYYYLYRCSNFRL